MPALRCTRNRFQAESSATSDNDANNIVITACRFRRRSRLLGVGRWVHTQHSAATPEQRCCQVGVVQNLRSPELDATDADELVQVTVASEKMVGGVPHTAYTGWCSYSR